MGYLALKSMLSTNEEQRKLFRISFLRLFDFPMTLVHMLSRDSSQLIVQSVHFHVITDVIQNFEKFLRMSAIFTKNNEAMKTRKKHVSSCHIHLADSRLSIFTMC